MKIRKLLKFKSVTKAYSPGIVAVEDISFEIAKGEFVFVVGPSGSGKTTLIKMLIREEDPSEGEIYFHDDDITEFKRNQVYQLRRKIGVIFQDFKLIPELNAYENVAFAMEVAGRNEKEIKEHVPYLLDIVGLGKRLDFFPKQLSGGEKQRVAIARAMANNPELLIADEPTGNLDPESAWDIVQILSKINNWGTTVLMSTHGSDIVNTLHKRVLKMENGKLVRDDLKGTYEELDKYSIKVISEQEKPVLEQKKITPEENTEEIETDEAEDLPDAEAEDNTDNISETELEKEDKNDADEKKDNKNEVKENTKRKKLPKINFSAKTSKKKNKPAPTNKDLEEKILEEIEKELPDDKAIKDLEQEAKQTKLKDLDLTKKIREILQDNDYKTVADIVDAGMKKIKKIDTLSKADIENIKKSIEKFVEK